MDYKTAAACTSGSRISLGLSSFSYTLVLWVQIRVVPESQMSSSEFSSSEEQMRERRPSYKGYATLPRVQRRTGPGVVHGELASGCVRVPNGTFVDLIV